MQMQRSLHSLKPPHHSNLSTKSYAPLLTPIQDPRPSYQKPQAPMEAMDVSGSRLCQIIQDAGLRPRTAQHFQMVLATTGVIALVDAGFTSRMYEMMVGSIRKFTAVKSARTTLPYYSSPRAQAPRCLPPSSASKVMNSLKHWWPCSSWRSRRRMCTSRPHSPRSASPCKKPSTCTSTSTRKLST
jgi:hypothetical protein